MAVEVFDDERQAASRGEKGELVCTKPFPSMPLGFWNDPDGAQVPRRLLRALPERLVPRRLRRAHGAGGMIIYGRSDAVLNPGGVRIGTAEIYRQVEQLDEVEESDRHRPGLGGRRARRAVRAAARRASRSTTRSTTQIKQQIRDNTTPRHVPAKILQVADIPRTKSGKIVELAVRDVVHGRRGQEPRGARQPRGARAVQG